MFFRNHIIFICLLSLQMLNEILGNDPQVQTSVFKGVPDNWATSIDTDPFVKIGRKYYYIETREKMTWYKAAHECRSRNSDLASIENAAEADAFTSYLKTNNLNLWFWTSGNDLSKEGSFFWMGTGNPISYTFWRAGQPDNQGNNENCILIQNIQGKYQMNDENCKTESHFICEAKTPTTVAITVW